MPDELDILPTARQRSRFERGFDAALSVQRPVVLAHLRSIRSRRPDATPTQLIAILERRYLTAVTTGGALVGASAVIPAVGVGTSLVLSGVETAGFLEATALFAQSVTEVHGIAVDDPERASTLVMTMMLGPGGQELLRQFAGQAAGGSGRNAFWGELITKNLPSAALSPIADRIQKMFVRRFAASQGSSVVGRMIPFGIGAVVGGGGNHLMGRRVITSARSAFGPAPAVFPPNLEPRPRAPKTPKAPKVPKPRAVTTPKAAKPKALPRGRSAYPMLPPARRDEAD